MSQFNIIRKLKSKLCQFSLSLLLPTKSRSKALEQNRHSLLIIILLVLVSINSFANLGLQEKAEKAYGDKDYKAAVQAYETILKEGAVSYKLYYNLGNAYYKNNEIGKAIYSYELANKLEPNDKDIKNNLKIANQKTIDKIESKENFFIGAIKSGLVTSLSTAGWAWLSIISLTTTLLLAFMFFVTNKIALKRIGFFFAGISLIVFVGSMVLGFTALNDKHVINFAIILRRESKIYEEPTAESNSKFKLHEGTRVSVLEANSIWTNIKLENGNEGWVKTTDVGLF